MKKLLFIMTALAAGAMTGCNPTGGGTLTDRVRLTLSRTEQSPGLTVKTEWEYDEMNHYAEEKETRTENGSVVYVVDEYENNLETDNTFVRYRTLADGTRLKLVSTYNSYGITKNEILDGTITLEVEEASFSDVYKYSNYKLTKRDSETGENLVVLHRYDYTYEPSSYYDNNKAIPVSHTYKEVKNGGEPVPMAHIVGSGDDTDNNINTYKIYSNWTGSEETSTLIEQKHAFEIDEGAGNSFSVEYKITRYNAEGLEPVITTYTEEYETVEVTYEY